MNNTKVHFIIGNPNVGKTTTAWLVYLLLKEKGKVEYFHLFRGDYQYNIPEETENPANEIITFEDYYDSSKKRPYDFCAIIIIGHISICIMSPGDNEEAILSGYKWFEKKQPNVFVGCCRSNFNSYARKALYNKYENQYEVIFHRLYHDYVTLDFEKACASRKKMAEVIVENILDKYRK